jgi:hypothetical protein
MLCDAMIDTLHWSGGNSSLDALACSLPVVTLPGAFMRGRQSAGMLSLLGVPELIAADHAGYLAIAARLAGDESWRRSSRRASVRRNRACSMCPTRSSGCSCFLRRTTSRRPRLPAARRQARERNCLSSSFCFHMPHSASSKCRAKRAASNRGDARTVSRKHDRSFANHSMSDPRVIARTT